MIFLCNAGLVCRPRSVPEKDLIAAWHEMNLRCFDESQSGAPFLQSQFHTRLPGQYGNERKPAVQFDARQRSLVDDGPHGRGKPIARIGLSFRFTG